MKREEKLEIRASIMVRVALHASQIKEIFSDLCRIHGSSPVTLRTLFRLVKNFKGVNVFLRTVTFQEGLLLQRCMVEDDRYTRSQIVLT